VKEVPVVAEWVTIPENVSVVVTGVGVVGDELEPHPAAPSKRAVATDNTINLLLTILRMKTCLPRRE
jgi:hypothetical protein